MENWGVQFLVLFCSVTTNWYDNLNVLNIFLIQYIHTEMVWIYFTSLKIVIWFKCKTNGENLHCSTGTPSLGTKTFWEGFWWVYVNSIQIKSSMQQLRRPQGSARFGGGLGRTPQGGPFIFFSNPVGRDEEKPQAPDNGRILACQKMISLKENQHGCKAVPPLN